MKRGGNTSVLDWLVAGYANPAASAMSTELWLGSTACLIFLYFEAKRLNMNNKWLYIIGAQLLGFVVFMPFFFMVREKHLAPNCRLASKFDPLMAFDVTHSS